MRISELFFHNKRLIDYSEFEILRSSFELWDRLMQYRSGGIEEYNMTMDTNSYVYSALNSQMLEEDGESLRDGIISKGGEYNEVWDGDKVKIQISGYRLKKHL